MTYRKTQSVQRYLRFIDTPGEYLENRGYYKALIVTSADADVIGLVQDCASDETWLPPMFSSAFSKEVIGIVTKTDLAKSEKDIHRAEETLKNAGAVRLFDISAVDGTGIDRLTAYIDMK